MCIVYCEVSTGLGLDHPDIEDPGSVKLLSLILKDFDSIHIVYYFYCI